MLNAVDDFGSKRCSAINGNLSGSDAKVLDQVRGATAERS